MDIARSRASSRRDKCRRNYQSQHVAHIPAPTSASGGKMVARVSMALLIAAAVLASGSSRAADKVEYIVGWIPTGEEAYPYVAAQEGYFAAEGLDVTIRVGRGSLDVFTKLAAGTADFGDAAVGALMGAVAQGPMPVKAVFSIYSKQPDCFITVKGSGISS